jgi:hypothetical protein
MNLNNRENNSKLNLNMNRSDHWLTKIILNNDLNKEQIYLLAKTKTEHYLNQNKEQIYLRCLLLSSFLYAQKKLIKVMDQNPQGFDLIMI